MLKLHDVYKAAENTKRFIKLTPLIKDFYISSFISKEVFLKLENLQITNAFKVRGSANIIPQLSPQVKRRGLITASTGNHGQGFAYIAGRLGVNAIVVVPKNAPIKKIQAIKHYGAKIISYGETYYEAAKFAHQIEKEERRQFIHSFDDEGFFAGNAPIYLEIVKQLPHLDTIIVPIGGGGLAAGLGFVAKSLNPKIKIYGVEPNGAPSMYLSVKRGCLITLNRVQSIADGLMVKQPSSLSLLYVKKFVDEIFLVSDSEIKQAIFYLYEKNNLIVEGAGAASLAALKKYRQQIKGKNIAVIISGGNIDLLMFLKIIKECEEAK